MVRNIWVRDWIARRPQLGLYDRLMVELRNEDPRAFQNFMRMPPVMYDEIVQRLTPALTKETTNWRAPLEPGLKVAITLNSSYLVPMCVLSVFYCANEVCANWDFLF